MFQLYGQTEQDLYVETQSGYESNILRAPNSFIEDGVQMGPDEIQLSSFYQEVDIRGLITRSWGPHKFSVRLQPKGRFYFSEGDASYYTVYSRLRYENELNRNTRWLLTARYNFRDRDGNNLDDNELLTPLGYGHLEFSSGLFFRMYPQNRSFIEVRYANRDYTDGEVNDLKYDLFGVDAVIRNVFKRPEGYHSYGIETGFSNRQYTRTFVDPEEPATVRNWNYFYAEGFYRYPVTRELRIRPGFRYMIRTDTDTGRFSYSEIRPSVEISYNGERFSADFNASYVDRTFDQLRAVDTDNNDLGRLQFQYLRLRLDLEHAITDNLALVGTFYMNNRESNRTRETSLLFRSYNYNYSGIGLRFTL